MPVDVRGRARGGRQEPPLPPARHRRPSATGEPRTWRWARPSSLPDQSISYLGIKEAAPVGLVLKQAELSSLHTVKRITLEVSVSQQIHQTRYLSTMLCQYLNKTGGEKIQLSRCLSWNWGANYMWHLHFFNEKLLEIFCLHNQCTLTKAHEKVTPKFP